MTLYVDDHDNYEVYVCETCGPEYQEFTVGYTENGWEACVHTGCYGGESIIGTRREVLEWLRNEREWVATTEFFDLESFDDVVRSLEQA